MEKNKRFFLKKCFGVLFFVAAVLQPLCCMEVSAKRITPIGTLTNNTRQGAWKQYDKQGAPVTFEWYNVTDRKTSLNLWQEILRVRADAFADLVLGFLDENFNIKKEYADAVMDFYKNREELVSVIAFAKLERKTRVELRVQQCEQEYKEAFLAQDVESSNFEPFYLVIAKNSIDEVLGYVTFYIKQELSKKDVELRKIAVLPAAQGKGLSRLLAFSILKLVPKINRIFLKTLAWNTKAHAIYKSLEFTEIESERKGCHVNFEYVVK